MYIDNSFVLFFAGIFFTNPYFVMANRSEENNNMIITKERKTFARNLRKARKEADLTQEDLVRKTGLSQAFISGVETAKSTLSLDNASRLAEAVGKPLRSLLEPLEK